MRVLSAFVALVLVVIMMTQVLFASAKDLCNPITISGKTVDPSKIPNAIFTDMTNRGRGTPYYMEVNVCSPATSPYYLKNCLRRYGNPVYCPATGCGGSNYINMYNYQNATCLASFDKPLMRPTANKDGFKVAYTSSTQPKDNFELMVLCNPLAKNDTLVSRSNKFAILSPNKNGGSTYMAVLFTHAVCAGGSHHHETREPVPTGNHHHSEEPSSELPPIPSGGGSGSSSGLPPIPSGGAGSDSGLPPIPSGGAGGAGSESGVPSQQVDNDDHKHSSFPSEVAHHHHDEHQSGLPSEMAHHHHEHQSGLPSEMAHHHHEHQSGLPSEMAHHHHEHQSGLPSEIAHHHDEHQSGLPPIPSGNH